VFKRFFQRHSTTNSPLADFVRQAFGFRLGNISIYEQAFRHSSVAIKAESGIKNSNERLEYLGDAILDSIVAHYLYDKYPDMPEGELTKMKAKIVSRRNLNAIGRALELPALLDMDLGGQEVHQSIVGNAFEALVGAIYLDKGFNVTQKVMIKLLLKHGLDSKIHVDVDFKSKLHEWSQKEKKSLEFRVIDERQENGTSQYTVAVIVAKEQMGIGKGHSKKTAEQHAAREACKQLFDV
jgi:ribonuclease III